MDIWQRMLAARDATTVRERRVLKLRALEYVAFLYNFPLVGMSVRIAELRPDLDLIVATLIFPG